MSRMPITVEEARDIAKNPYKADFPLLAARRAAAG